MKIEHEFQKDIDKFKIDTVNRITRLAETTGMVLPQIPILYHDHGGGIRDFTVSVPVEYTQSDQSKDFLTTIVIPMLLDMFKKSNRTIICLAWVMEAWIWEANKNDYDNLEHLTHKRYDEIKANAVKTEVVMISFETEFEFSPTILKKVGSGINAKGEAIGRIRLEPHKMNVNPDTYSGRFTNLFKQQHAKN